MNDGDPEFARVEALPAAYANQILCSPSVQRIRTLYSLILPLASIAGVCILVWAGVTQRHGIDDAESSKISRAYALYAGGIFIFASLLLIRLTIGDQNQWLRRIAKSAIRRRPDKKVDPDALAARFVEVVPKSNWQDDTSLEKAIDVGFLVIDFPSAQLLFEGDNERYQIPAQAIVKCEQDSYTRLMQDPFAKGSHNKIVHYHFVVVTVKTSPSLTVEIPFRIRKAASLWCDQKARDANYEFFKEIIGLRANERTNT